MFYILALYEFIISISSILLFCILRTNSFWNASSRCFIISHTSLTSLNGFDLRSNATNEFYPI